jgi:hypothetical protein
MEGYSVTEAASVLGVPTERVWELLARGVLAGAPEGETGMRVFLQPRPAPPTAEPRPANGGGEAEPQRELSPFRELLSEFRNLTERYGQALLALGEARGEVAALRSRVDLLEARMDLRLPGGASAAPPVGWTQPMPWQPPPPPASSESPEPDAEPEPEPAAAAGEETLATRAEAPGSVDADRDRDPAPETEPRTRRSSSREAIASFAEALARAQDPSAPELPPAPESSGGPAARAGATNGEDPAMTDVALPRELPPADDVPVAEEPGPAEEPAAAEPPRTEEQPAETEPPVAEASAEGATEAEEAGNEMPEPAEPRELVAGADTAEAPDERVAWQDDRYTAEIGDPDWLEAEAYPQASRLSEPGEEPDEAPHQAPAEQTDVAGAEPSAEQPPAEPPGPAGEPAAVGDARDSDPDDVAAEETVMWFGRAAEEMEIAPGRGPSAEERTSAPPPKDDAFAALEELSRSTPPRATSPREAEPRQSTPPAPEPDPMRVRQVPPTPAGRAYRRLRRIFPGQG